MTYVPPEFTSLTTRTLATRPVRPPDSASNPIPPSWLRFLLLASTRSYALNNPTRRVCLCTCGGAIRGADVTTLPVCMSLVHSFPSAHCRPLPRCRSSTMPSPVLRHVPALF
ncbi:hypothetical protein B0H19DRAFT_1271207 [Mycena capillaripes]|nr:hypothetical protein B0H19DRAFT_1271207 [Mycena capillaripes]